MTAKELFLNVGLTNSGDLARKTGLSKSRAQQIWEGRGGIGRKCAEMIFQTLGIDRALLRSVDYTPSSSPGSRRRRCP